MNQRIAGEARQPAADNGSDSGAQCHKKQARHLQLTVYDTKRHRANGREERKAQRRSRRQTTGRRKLGASGLSSQRTVADLIHHRRDGQHLAHIDANRLDRDDLRNRSAVDLNRQLTPIRQYLYWYAKSTSKPFGGNNRSFRGLTVSKQERRGHGDRVQCRLSR